VPAALICSASPSSDTRELLANAASRDFCSRYSEMPRALSHRPPPELIASLRQRFHTDNFHRRRGGASSTARRDRQTWRGLCRIHCQPQNCRLRSGSFCTNTVATGRAHDPAWLRAPLSRGALGSSFHSPKSPPANHFHQQIQIRFLLGGNVDEYGLPPHSSGIRHDPQVVSSRDRQGIGLCRSY